MHDPRADASLRSRGRGRAIPWHRKNITGELIKINSSFNGIIETCPGPEPRPRFQILRSPWAMYPENHLRNAVINTDPPHHPSQPRCKRLCSRQSNRYTFIRRMCAYITSHCHPCTFLNTFIRDELNACPPANFATRVHAYTHGYTGLCPRFLSSSRNRDQFALFHVGVANIPLVDSRRFAESRSS